MLASLGYSLGSVVRTREPRRNVIDAETLSRLWRQHADRLLLIARSVGEPADDAVQEAFVALARQQALPDDPLAWLICVARNQLLQWRRSGGRRAARERHSSVSEAWFQLPDERVAERLDAHQATEWLQELPGAQREAIVMHLWGGLSFDEIATIVDSSRSTVHRRYHDGLQQLRLKMNPPSSPVTASRAAYPRVSP